MSAISAPLFSTLKESAHQDLKDAYPRIVIAGLFLALGVHLALLFGVLPGSSAVPLQLRVPDPPVIRYVNVDYDVIPEAVPIPRPAVPDADFDEIVPDHLLLPEVEPTEIPPWAKKLPPGLSAGGDRLASAFVVAPEVPPELLHRVAPVYPELARMAEAEGRVVLQVWIDVDGRVRDVQVAQSDVASSLERAAIEAVRQWLFSPARQGGQPVAVRVHVPIEFRLH